MTSTPSRSAAKKGRESSSKKGGLALVVEAPLFAICRMHPRSRIPRWVHDSSFYTVSRSRDELSIVVEQSQVPDGVKSERDWTAIRVLETLDFSLIGVLASLATPLTEAKVSIFCISTFDTDYLLVRHKNLERARRALEDAGHHFVEDPDAETGDEGKRSDEAAPKTQEREKHKERAKPKERAKLKERAEPEENRGEERQEDEDDKPRRRKRQRDNSSQEAQPTQEARDRERNRPRSSRDEEPKARAERKPPRRRAQREDTSPVEPPQPTPPAEDMAPAPASEELGEPSEDKGGARDRVARALAELGSALRSPWRARTEEDHGIDAEPTLDGGQAKVEEISLDVEVDLPHEEAAAALEPEPDGDGDGDEERSDSASTEDEAAEEKEGGRRRSARGRVRRSRERSRRQRPSREEPREESRDEPKEEVEIEVEWGNDEPDDEEEVLAEGLFTGAIPQKELEVTSQSFGHLGLSNDILETVHKVGFQHPTPIQASVIPEALKGRDVIGLAETGSGKTAAFCLPLLERLIHGRGTRGLILSPTREIALQTKAFLDSFCRDHKLQTVAVIGGVKMGPQIDAFRRNADILVATPGRLADHLRRRNVSLDKLQELVLDEADHMLDLGFLPQIKEILQQAPKNRRTLMFSATMPPPIERLTKVFMNDPLLVDIRPVGQVAEGIEHRLYLVKDDDKKACVLQLLREITGSTLVFTRRKIYTEWLARQMELAGLKAARIHSDRSQSQRVKALKGFREGQFRILVATDVAARGLDVPRIEHVINYSLPETIEDYVHRAGRTARGNSVGVVSSIATWQDKVMIRDIERILGKKIERHTAEGVEPYKELPKRRGRRRRLL